MIGQADKACSCLHHKGTAQAPKNSNSSRIISHLSALLNHLLNLVHICKIAACGRSARNAYCHLAKALFIRLLEVVSTNQRYYVLLKTPQVGIPSTAICFTPKDDNL